MNKSKISAPNSSASAKATADKQPSPSITTKLTWLPKKTFELEFTLPWTQVKTTYDKILNDLAGQTTIKGFRKGKAPLNMVEDSLDKQKLYERVIKELLPQTYEFAVKKHSLRPIITPKIQPLDLKDGQNWRFKATACEAPAVKLGNYLEPVKGELAKLKLWTPDKGKPDKKEADKPSYDQRLNLVTKTLLTNIQVEIADILLEDEVSRMLTRLLDQVNSLGMTIEQYLASKNQTSQQLRQIYQKQAEDTLKLEFILQAIVLDQKIKVEETEVDKMINATPDEKIRQKLSTPLQRAYISSILAKRQVLDTLTNL